MLPIPNHHERQFMQQLRGRGWVKASDLPAAPIITKRLIERLWIECQGTGRDLSYRITEQGLAAKKAPIPDGRRKRRGDGNGEVVQPDQARWLHQAQ
jgi:hypothetical protein